MGIYVTTTAAGKITGVFDERVEGAFGANGSTIPGNAVPISDELFAQWQANRAQVYVAGALAPYTAPAPDLGAASANQALSITQQTQVALAAARSGYADDEVATWPQQIAEALAYQANSSAVTPLLSAIAAARGTTVAALAPLVVANNAAHNSAIATIFERQRTRLAALAAATTLQQIQAA